MRIDDFKKYSCLFLALIIIFSSIYVTDASASVSVDYFEDFNDTEVQEFDAPWAEETDSYGACVESDGTLKTWVSSTHPVKMTHGLGKTVSSGMLYIAFDYMSADGFNDSFLRLLSGEVQYQICGFRNTGKFGHFKNFSVWALEDTAVDYSPDVWYTVGVLFDMESRSAYFYFGEQGKELELIETAVLPEAFADITDIVLVQSYGEYPPAIWDNIRVNMINPTAIDMVEKRDKLTFDGEIYRKYINEICTEDFEDDILNVAISGWTEESATNGMMRVPDGEDYVAKTWVDSKYPKRFTYSFDKPINDGMYYVSFDWKTEGEVNDSFIRLMSGDSQYQICGFRNDGYFGKFVDFSKWALNSASEVEYTGDTWYTIGILLDLDLKKIYIYMGERGKALNLIEKSNLNDGMSDFTDIVFVHSYGDYLAAMWDNIKVYKLKAETALLVEKEEGVVFDESVKEKVACIASTNNKGNIFYNADTADINMTFYNRSVADRTVDVKYEVKNGDKNIVMKEAVDMLTADSRMNDILTIPVYSSYGFYDVNIYADNVLVCETRVSNVHAAEDGVRNNKIGSTVHMTRVSDKEAAFEILENGGFASARGGQNDWQDVEIEKGVYHKDTANDAYYTLACDKGFENITILKGSNSLYADEYPTTNPDREGLVESPPQSDGLIEKFACYCYETVMMYPQVKYFQIWNEWNNAPVFNNDNVTDAAAYAKLLKAGYEAVKAAEKDRGKEALVVAMAPSGTKPDWIMEVLQALDSKKYFDIISVHPYTYTDGGLNSESTYAPEDICVRHTKEYGDIVTRIQAVYEVLNDFGYEDIPVWAGEFGYSSYICGEDKQAQYAVRTMALCDGNGLLDKMIWYTFQNHLSSNEKEQNFGMIRFDVNDTIPYEAKPVYLAMSNYNAIMTDATPIEALSHGEDGIYIYRFESRQGNELYTVWSVSGEKNALIETDAVSADVYDIYGNKTTVFSDNGCILLNVSESMQYIEIKDTYVKLLQDNVEVTKLSSVSDKDVILTAEANGYDTFDVIVAQYRDNVLKKAEMYSSPADNVNLGKIEDIDKIEVFMWNDMLPICEKLVIE